MLGLHYSQSRRRPFFRDETCTNESLLLEKLQAFTVAYLGLRCSAYDKAT